MPTEQTTKLVIVSATPEERMRVALYGVATPIPSTKGMGPKDRANRLHAELERRIALAKEALHAQP